MQTLRLHRLPFVLVLITCHGLDAFVSVSGVYYLPSSSSCRNGLCGNNGSLPMQPLNQHESDATTDNNNALHKLPEKRRRKGGGISSKNNASRRSRAILTSFEEVCQRKRHNCQGEGLIDLLNSMVEDIDIDGEKENENNISHHILPRDASSLIRLLGRNHAHNAMLSFCRRYCRDIHNSDKAGREETREAIVYAYTAVIAAISKPPPTSLASSMDQQQYDAVNATNYRSREHLLSLLNEMENEYKDNDDDIPIRPNSYTLSAVLLGIDDPVESMDVLELFEDKYNKQDEESDNIVTIQLYNVVIASCSKDSNSFSGGGWQLALSILQRIRKAGPQPNEQTYAFVIQACAESKQVKVALSIVDEMRQSCTIAPTTKLYIPLLKVCAKSGDSATADSLINIMKEDGLEITTEILNIYLSSLAKSKLHLRALGVLQEMMTESSLTPPDIYTFNTVLGACANAGDFEAAYALLEQMRDGLFEFPSQVSPDVVSYNSVISCAEPEVCIDLIQEMRLTRRNREGVIKPNSVTFVNAITQCRKASLEEDDPAYHNIAMYLLDLAREDKVELNVFVYSSAIWMAEAEKDYQTAVRLLREMECSPNAICYDGVISALSYHGMHREALYFFYEMQHLELPATKKTYQKLVFAINNSREPALKSYQKRASLLEGVLSAMPKSDKVVAIGGPIFQSLIRNYGSMDISTSYQAARRVFDSIVGPSDDGCLSAMLKVCSQSTKRAEEALLLLHSSDVVGPALVSPRALSYAVIACSKSGKWEDALTLLELYGRAANQSKLISSQRGVVSLKAINSVIGACGRSGRADMAVEILNEMTTKYGVRPNEVSYRLSIIACNQAEHSEMRMRQKNHDSSNTTPELKWWECALSLLRRMKEDDIKPSLQTFSSCVSACEAASEWQRALGVLELMPLFSSLGGNDEEIEKMDAARLITSNLYCLNAAISACEKGG